MITTRSNTNAQTLLTEIYLNGIGKAVNYSEALKWAKLAGEKGHPVAQNYVGLIYYEGLGVPPNHAEAGKWLDRSAKSGLSIAVKLLSDLKQKNFP